MQKHASAVAVGDRGCLITGSPGAGKSTLALEMIALGAVLVSDDRVDIDRQGDALIMSPPPAIAGMIEARGCGLIRMRCCEATLTLIADLDARSSERLPSTETRDLLGCACPVIFAKQRPGLSAILVAALGNGGFADPDATV